MASHRPPQWYQEADIWAVYPQRPSTSGRIKRALLILPGTFLSDFSSWNYCKRAARTVLTGMGLC
jgi:hypothetical protein